MDLNKTYLTSQSRGLTLVELLVAITILSVIIMITLSILLNMQKTNRLVEKKYACNAEADRLVRDMENTLRQVRQLITATYNKVEFLDVYAETVEYYQKYDTLFKNRKIATDLAVDSVLFTCVKYENGVKISGFAELDLDNNAVLDTHELSNISGIYVHLRLSSDTKTKVEKDFFVQFRNMNY